MSGGAVLSVTRVANEAQSAKYLTVVLCQGSAGYEAHGRRYQIKELIEFLLVLA